MEEKGKNVFLVILLILAALTIYKLDSSRRKNKEASLTPTVALTPAVELTTAVTPTVALTPAVELTTALTPTVALTPAVEPTTAVTPTVTPTIGMTKSFYGEIVPFEKRVKMNASDQYTIDGRLDVEGSLETGENGIIFGDGFMWLGNTNGGISVWKRGEQTLQVSAIDGYDWESGYGPSFRIREENGILVIDEGQYAKMEITLPKGQKFEDYFRINVKNLREGAQIYINGELFDIACWERRQEEKITDRRIPFDVCVKMNASEKYIIEEYLDVEGIMETGENGIIFDGGWMWLGNDDGVPSVWKKGEQILKVSETDEYNSAARYEPAFRITEENGILVIDAGQFAKLEITLPKGQKFENYFRIDEESLRLGAQIYVNGELRIYNRLDQQIKQIKKTMHSITGRSVPSNVKVKLEASEKYMIDGSLDVIGELETGENSIDFNDGRMWLWYGNDNLSVWKRGEQILKGSRIDGNDFQGTDYNRPGIRITEKNGILVIGAVNQYAKLEITLPKGQKFEDYFRIDEKEMIEGAQIYVNGEQIY